MPMNKKVSSVGPAWTQFFKNLSDFLHILKIIYKETPPSERLKILRYNQYLSEKSQTTIFVDPIPIFGDMHGALKINNNLLNGFGLLLRGLQKR